MAEFKLSENGEWIPLQYFPVIGVMFYMEKLFLFVNIMVNGQIIFLHVSAHSFNQHFYILRCRGLMHKRSTIT